MTDDEAIQAATALHAPAKEVVESTPAEVVNWLKSMKLESMGDSSLGKVGMVLAKDPAFRESYGKIQQSFQLNLTLGYLAGWILLIWILRAWRLSKAGTWLTRIWTQFWVSIVSWWGILVVVPMLLWGKSYQMLMATLLRAMIHQFWT